MKTGRLRGMKTGRDGRAGKRNHMHALRVLGGLLLWSLGAGASGCSGGVEASGCFDYQDLDEQQQVGVDVTNACDYQAFCTIKVAYECNSQTGPVIVEHFELASLGTTRKLVTIPCNGTWRYAKTWQCTEGDYPEIQDPTL
jgi:hypothetical protein